MENPKYVTGTFVLITLLRARQEGFRHETWEDDFVIHFPEDGPTDSEGIRDYAEKALRKASAILTRGADAVGIIRRSDCDYNWGDFINELSTSVQEASGVYFLDVFVKKYGQKGIDLLHHQTVTVHQDESLLEECAPCLVKVRTEDGEMTFKAICEQGPGAISLDDDVHWPDSVLPGSVTVKFTGYDMDFPELPVALSDEGEERDRTHFFILE